MDAAAVAPVEEPSRRAPTVLERGAMGLVFRAMAAVRRGSLEVILPDGARREFGSGEPRQRMSVRSWSFFPRVAAGGDVAFGEAYTAGDIETPDLTGLLRLFVENAETMSQANEGLAKLSRAVNRARHLLRPNDLTGSRRNVRAHYDLGNDMFGLFLDRSLTYSCALFEGPSDDLERAQRNKRLAVLRKARVGPRHHLLEIGSGWGAFALDAVRETGCRVTTITLSEEQLRHVRRLAQRAGVADRLTVELCDYRSMTGTFDRIVSIEMIEAVGHEFLGAFFKACDRLLAPGGLMVLQAITIPDQRYESFRRSCDWIQKHIFPGSAIPSLSAMSGAMTRSSGFIIESLENIGIHYAPTLRLWKERFLASRRELERMGYGREFQRAWEYYFSYCEAGFAARILGDLQLVLTRANNNEGLPRAEALLPA